MADDKLCKNCRTITTCLELGCGQGSATPPPPSTAPEVDERAAFEAWARDPIRAAKLPLERWPTNGAYKDTRTYIAFYGWKSGRAALASRPAEVDDEGLPPLPEPHWTRSESFTAEQFRQGQRDAVAADRAQRRQTGQPLVGPDWRALGYVEGATVRLEIGPGRYDDAVITYAYRNGALDVEIKGRAYGWSARSCKVVAAPAVKRATG